MNQVHATRRQRVLTALARRQPERVPFSWQFCATAEMQQQLESDLSRRGLSWPRLRQWTEDIAFVNPAYCGPPEFAGGVWDIWGIRWESVDYGGGSYREVAQYPLATIATIDQLDAYPWPDPDWYDYDAFAAVTITGERAVRMNGWNPFETLCWMTGLEEVLCRCAIDREWVVRALEHITGFYEQRVRRALTAAGDGIDIVFFADDLGGQNGPIISPAMYRDILQPFHRQLFQAAKELAPHTKIMMHSDGSVVDVLDDVIDAGLDILEAVQTDCAGMDPAALKQRFGNRIAFHGGISVQQLLPHADADTVEAECRRLVEVFGAGGGYIAAPAHAIQVGTPTANVLAVLRGVLGKDDYAAALHRSAV